MISVGEISCCLEAAALYLLGRSCEREADALSSVTRVNQLKDLAQLLDAASRVLPLVVAVSGRVGSDKPINCENCGLRVVILEQTIEQHYLKQNDKGSWVQDSALKLSRCQEVGWYLDDGTSRVDVVRAHGAGGLVLTFGSDVFEEKGQPQSHGTLDGIQGRKMLGERRIERVLPTGTPLTVVGEAVKDDIGAIRVQRPRKGPFYVSHRTIDQLIANYRKWSRLYKYAAIGFAVYGVYLLAKHAIQYMMERRRRWEMQKRVHDAAAKKYGQEEAGLNEKAENESDSTNRDRMMPDLCVICLEHEYNSVFVPCGHMCCCMACSSHLIDCPLCRRRIEQVVRTFRH